MKYIKIMYIYIFIVSVFRFAKPATVENVAFHRTPDVFEA